MFPSTSMNSEFTVTNQIVVSYSPTNNKQTALLPRTKNNSQSFKKSQILTPMYLENYYLLLRWKLCSAM